jgi:hypothetical protein
MYWHQHFECESMNVQIKVQSVDKVFSDGAHSAFTDLTYWQGQYYLAFRRGTAHNQVGMGNIYVLATKTPGVPCTWRQVATIDSGFDDRDPKFFTHRNRLGIVFGSYLPRQYHHGGSISNAGYDICSHVSLSHNGASWSRPIQVSRVNYWLWSVVELDTEIAELITEQMGLLYTPTHMGASYHPIVKNDNYSSIFLHLADGPFRWQILDCIEVGSLGTDVSEPALLLSEADKQLTCIVRAEPFRGSRRPGPAIRHVMSFQDYSKGDPEKVWKQDILGDEIHSPCLMPYGESGYLIAGRQVVRNKYDIVSTTSVWNAGGDLLCQLPSEGDNGYPGLAPGKDGIIYASYYSQHEVDKHRRSEMPVQSDIFVAALEASA